MIHKFVSNDNKGNVNVFELGSDYTKIGNLVDPVDPGDAVSKGYLAEGNILLVEFTPEPQSLYGYADHSNADIASAVGEGKRVFGKFIFSETQTTYFEINSASEFTTATYPAIYGFCPAIVWSTYPYIDPETGEDVDHPGISSAEPAWLIMPESDEPNFQFAFKFGWM